MDTNLRAVIQDLEERWHDYWIAYWYRRNKCPICKEPIKWEDEFEGMWDYTGYSYPVHIDDKQDEECEGVC